MSNRFLQTGETTSLLTTAISCQSVACSTFNPGTTLKTNSVRQIVSAELDIGDINGLQTILDSTITTPFLGTIDATNFQTADGDLNDVISRTQNITAIAGQTDVTGEIYQDTYQTVLGKRVRADNVVLGSCPTLPAGTGTNNMLVGDRSLLSLNSGSYNVSLGHDTNTGGYAQSDVKEATCIGSVSVVKDRCTSVGYQATCTGTQSVAMGWNAQALGDDCVAIGTQAVTLGQEAVVVGPGTQSGGTGVCVGAGASTTSDNCVLLGAGCTSTNPFCIALGKNIAVTTPTTCVIGGSTITVQQADSDGLCDMGGPLKRYKDAHYSGTVNAAGVAVSGDVYQATELTALAKRVRTDSVVLGSCPTLPAGTGTYNMLVGDRSLLSLNNGSFNVSLGHDTNFGGYAQSDVKESTCVGAQSAVTDRCTSVGFQALCTADQSVAVGWGSQAQGYSSVAIGNQAAALAQEAVVAGSGAQSGTTGVCVGAGASTTSDNCVLLGAGCTSSNAFCVAVGRNIAVTTPTTCVIGGSTITVNRPDSNGLCDLGASGNQYKDAYFSGTSKSLAVDAATVSSTTGTVLVSPSTLLNITAPRTNAARLYVGAGTRPVCSSGFSMYEDGTQVTNTTTETSILNGTALGSLAIGAYTMMAGTTNYARMAGSLANKNNGILTLRYNFFSAGPTTVTSTLTHNFGGANTARPFTLMGMYTVVSTGVTGTLRMNWQFTYKDGTDGISGELQEDLLTLDTTVPQLVSVTAQWDTADVLNSITVQQANNFNTHYPVF